MKYRKSITIIIATFAILINLPACTNTKILRDMDGKKLDVPEEVAFAFENYMNAYKIGTDKSVEYAHFEEDFIREAYIDTNSKMIDYKIESSEKINDSLYEFNVLAITTQTQLYHGDEYQLAYNFVGLIDGKWYFMAGVIQIPENLKENFDENRYKYDNPNIVDPSDVLPGNIDIN